MDKSLFRYIWRFSRRDQLVIFAVVLVSLPFYYLSLDLPRRIVNEAIQGRAFQNGHETAPFLALSISWPAWIGGGETHLWGGLQLERLQLLYGLSFLFLFYVLVNGVFKYWINLAKGALGERMLRRLRFDLFSLALRFTPDTLRTVKSSEAATIIKDEVEPIGGFIGDAFIQPLLLGSQAATALTFILLQNVWLGLIAAAVVGVQFVVIPRMRRELLRLGRMRQIASRRLAGRIGEVIDGIEAVHVHNTSRWERAEIGRRLYELFDIRYRIYKRKFVVKFLNNLLAQMTPFFFYAVGGYFALRGRLDIGQLVAVIAAYRELPPPLKELIDWDQQRLDVQVKYDQVVGYFAAEKLRPVDEPAPAEQAAASLGSPLAIDDLTVFDVNGSAVIRSLSLRLDLPTHAALIGGGGPEASILARVLARREPVGGGEIRFGDRALGHLPAEVVGRRLAYAGPEPILFPGTLRDNILYGLRHEPLGDGPESGRTLELAEARRTGNPIDPIEASWVDLGHTGAADEEELDGQLLDMLRRLGLGPDLYRFGHAGLIDPERNPDLASQIVEARGKLREELAEQGMADYVEPFDPERYNTQATVAENLLFGVPRSRQLVGRALAEHEAIRQALAEAKLVDELVGMGARIAETMVELFRGLPPGHPLFEQFSFVHAEELVDFEEILKRFGLGQRRGGLSREDRTRLAALTMGYIEPRHRLGLLDDALRARLLEGRRLVRAALEAAGSNEIEFYDPETFNPAAPVRDNILFGRVNNTVAAARDEVRVASAKVIDELGLRAEVERVGLDHQVGPAGRLLTAAQRATVDLMRCLVKRPDLLVIDGAFSSFNDEQTAAALFVAVEACEGRSLAVVLPNEQHRQFFDVVVRFADGSVQVEREPGEAAERRVAAAAE
ncbi:MAG: ABC transporter ATP-binding protein [Methylobacteriaceae bacterium]|nr:ABC transporter ATP-binding protein [Methylobacteriaceae bacterium]